MGNLATSESLVMRWNELVRDPALQDLPYKIELNAWGKIEMSPASNRHGVLQMAVGGELMRRLPDGRAISDCSAYGEITPYVRSPEICVEIVSASNVQAEIDEKRSAYFAAGAKEVWLVFEDGSIRYFGPAGEKTRSDFPVCVTLPPPIPPKS